jgi:hypothetical protein
VNFFKNGGNRNPSSNKIPLSRVCGRKESISEVLFSIKWLTVDIAMWVIENNPLNEFLTEIREEND